MRLPASLSVMLATKRRRQVLLALAAGHILTQMSSLPVALSVGTLAKEFSVGIDEAAWIVIVYLLALGSGALLGARLGDRYGHSRVYVLGVAASTLGAGLIVVAQSLWEVMAFRAVSGVGAALMIGNANAILASAFPINERGRAFAVPIMGSRLGTLLGLASFGLSLQFATWRIAFATFLPIGILAVVASLGLIRGSQTEVEDKEKRDTGPIDFIGAGFIVASASVLILSTNHLHGGEESFTSSEALTYHLPMQFLFLGLVVIFAFVEHKVRNPIVDFRHFQQKYFTLSLVSNTAFHFSMLAAMTLVPILMEQGFGLSPIFVMIVLIPNQGVGLFMPMVAGWLYDKHGSRLFRPAAMATIALGFLALGLLAPNITWWIVPFLMLPITLGTAIFNPINNATVMSALPLEHRGVASGLLETTREIGHALGATASATALSMFIPALVNDLTEAQAQAHYFDGFRVATLMVMGVLFFGAVVASFHKTRRQPGVLTPSQAPSPSASPTS